MKVLIHCYECGKLTAFYQTFKVKVIRIKTNGEFSKQIKYICNNCIKQAGYKGREGKR